MFVYGGKTDQFNSYSYTSAPNTNDLLYLPLTNSFSTASPPWTLASNSRNSSSLQGPPLAWHTLSPFKSSNVLLFGGVPDPNSATVVVGVADSAERMRDFDSHSSLPRITADSRSIEFRVARFTAPALPHHSERPLRVGPSGR